ncbi:hypothetical protein BMS3Bbin15_00575 [archaeon BMS3Bbin15]|nr:hypothetical protein BMS3Bbin15_00575 [archaeon BMS3Bbin15]
MEIKYCPFCGRELVEKETICSACGSDLAIFLLMPSPDEISEEIKNVMESFMGDGAPDFEELTKNIDPSKAKGFFISVNMTGDRKPIIKTGEIKDLEDVLRDLPIPDFVRSSIEADKDKSSEMEFIEVKAEIKSNEANDEILIEMPDVKNIENVEIVKRGSLLEITGNGKTKIYFTEVDIGDKTVVDSSLESGMLKITIEKF